MIYIVVSPTFLHARKIFRRVKWSLVLSMNLCRARFFFSTTVFENQITSSDNIATILAISSRHACSFASTTMLPKWADKGNLASSILSNDLKSNCTPTLFLLEHVSVRELLEFFSEISLNTLNLSIQA